MDKFFRMLFFQIPQNMDTKKQEKYCPQSRGGVVHTFLKTPSCTLNKVFLYVLRICPILTHSQWMEFLEKAPRALVWLSTMFFLFFKVHRICSWYLGKQHSKKIWSFYLALKGNYFEIFLYISIFNPKQNWTLARGAPYPARLQLSELYLVIPIPSASPSGKIFLDKSLKFQNSYKFVWNLMKFCSGLEIIIISS